MLVVFEGADNFMRTYYIDDVRLTREQHFDAAIHGKLIVDTTLKGSFPDFVGAERSVLDIKGHAPILYLEDNDVSSKNNISIGAFSDVGPYSSYMPLKSLDDHASHSNNIAIGWQSMMYMVRGADNIGIGYNAIVGANYYQGGDHVVTGNVALGRYALYGYGSNYCIGDYNVGIGYYPG